MTPQKMEESIVKTALADLLSAGFTLTVDDGAGEQEVPQSVDALYEALSAVDDSTLWVYRDKRNVGCVYLVFGNDGYDVIADNTVWLEPYLAGATALSEKFIEELFV